ncbi:MAG: ImmA/IrrE family metallo-endopeptidase [Solirubrobacterales bacterium]
MEPGRDAWELLQRLWLTEGPDIIALPVDPWAISNKLGITVYRNDEMAPEVTGILRKAEGFNDPVIILNAFDSNERRRFICAHALGHYNRNTELNRAEAWEIVDGRELFAAPIGDAEESYATEFAAELLMPRAALDELAEGSTVVGLANLFGVTGDVMGFRLDQIGWRRR